jgi:hypothetical protein
MKAPVIVYPPEPRGRRVSILGEHAGIATRVADLLELLRRNGLNPDEVPLSNSEVVDWRGGGPDVWE